MPTIIPHSRPVFDGRYQQAIKAVIQSGFLASGDAVVQLQTQISQQLNRRHVLAVDSGTSALTLSIRALLQHKNGRVGIPAYACASLLFAVKAAGATPVFMDCNASLTLEQDQAWETAKTLDVLILVHPFGMVEPLMATSFPCPVIEDVAQSVGATMGDQAVGTHATVSIGSLYATKPWGGAYGGWVASEDEQLIQDIAIMCDPDQAPIAQPYAGHHQLSNIHAALAHQRINDASAAQAKRKLLSERYDNMIQNMPFSPMPKQTNVMSNYFRYIVRTTGNVETTIDALRQLGISASKPVPQPLHHMEPNTACPQADEAWRHCLSLPILTDMSDEEFTRVSQGLATCS